MLKNPKDFGLTETEVRERDLGFLGLSGEDRFLVQMLVDQKPLDKIAKRFDISIEEVKMRARNGKARAYRDHLERNIANQFVASRERVLKELSNIAFTSIDEVCEWNGEEVVVYDCFRAPVHARAAISEVSSSVYKGERIVKVKMLDKLSALNMLLKEIEKESDKLKDDEHHGDPITGVLEILNAARARAGVSAHQEDQDQPELATEQGPTD